MPAQFFTATDDKTTGTAKAYQRYMSFIRRNAIPLSPAIIDKDDIHDAIGEIWDGIGGSMPAMRSIIRGNLNAQASDLEVASLVMFVLLEKFTQYGATLPGGGSP